MLIVLILAPIYIGLNVYIFIRLMRFFKAIHEKLNHPVVWTVSIVAYVFFMLTPLTGYLIKREPYHHMLRAISNYWLGVLAIAAITLIFFDVARVILNKTKWKGDHPNAERFKIGGTCAIIIIALLSSYGFLHSKNIKINHQDVSISEELTAGTNIDSEKNSDKDTNKEGKKKLRIALVADTHLGYSIGQKHMEQMVEKINNQNPDIVIIAGDIFDNEYRAIKNPDKVAEVLKGLKSKYGTYACWGNHDVTEVLLAGFTMKKDGYSDDENFREFLKKANINILEDETLLIDNSFYLVGRKDLVMSIKLKDKRKNIEELIKPLNKNKPIFVIDHEPLELDKMAKAGVDLGLSGHTHNGQIFPGNILMKFIWDNPYGVKKVGQMTSCVTSGAGIWGPAMRLGTNSEIMILDVSSK